MFLSDVDIIKAVKNGDITIRDFSKHRLQPASYDITLGNKFVLTVGHSTGFVDPVNNIFPETEEVIVRKGGTFVLHPGINVLGASVEFFGSDKYLIHLSGKSSLARIGLMVHNTAGIVNPGHFLNITFELSNVNNIPTILHPGMAIAQITFSHLSSPPSSSYRQTGRYDNKNWNHFVSEKKRKVTSKKKVVKEVVKKEVKKKK